MANLRSACRSLRLVLFSLVLGPPARGDDLIKKPAEGGPPPPVSLTAQQDHQRIMDLLQITSLRRGADGRDRQAPNPANYDESKANPYPVLPDPLVLTDGRKVTTAAAWWKQRRPEIAEDFDREVYGRVPRDTPGVVWEVTATTREAIGGVPVLTKSLVGHVDNASYPPITVEIQLSLITPVDATGPVPVIMEFGFGGFGGRGPGADATTQGSAAAKPITSGGPVGPSRGGPSWQQQVLAKGWGYASLVPNSHLCR